jgi:hypothetical protein
LQRGKSDARSWGASKQYLGHGEPNNPCEQRLGMGVRSGSTESCPVRERILKVGGKGGSNLARTHGCLLPPGPLPEFGSAL